MRKCKTFIKYLAQQIFPRTAQKATEAELYNHFTLMDDRRGGRFRRLVPATSNVVTNGTVYIDKCPAIFALVDNRSCLIHQIPGQNLFVVHFLVQHTLCEGPFATSHLHIDRYSGIQKHASHLKQQHSLQRDSIVY